MPVPTVHELESVGLSVVAVTDEGSPTEFDSSTAGLTVPLVTGVRRVFRSLEKPRNLVYVAAWHAKGCVVLPHGLSIWCLK